MAPRAGAVHGDPPAGVVPRLLDLLERERGRLRVQHELAVPGPDEEAVRVDVVAQAAPAGEVVAVPGGELVVADVKVLGPVRPAAEVAHQPLEALEPAAQARRVQVVGAVHGGVEVQRRPVRDGAVQERPVALPGARVHRGVADPHLDRRVDVQALGRVRDAVGHVVRVPGLQLVDPGPEAHQGLGPAVEGDGPLVHDAWDVTRQVQQVVVDVVPERAVVVAHRRVPVLLPAGLEVLLGDDVGPPDDGAPRVGQPPDADKVGLGPELVVALPGAEHGGVGLDGLLPPQAEGGHGAEGDLGDDAEGAERQQGAPEEVRVLGGRARHRLAAGQDDLEGRDGLGEQAVLEGAAAGAGADDAGDGLLVDAAQHGEREAVLVELLGQLPEADAGLHDHQSHKTFLKSSRLTSQLLVHVRSEGEWAWPTVVMRRRHRRASFTAFSTSCCDCGWMYSSGSEAKVRAHVACRCDVRARKGMSSAAAASSMMPRTCGSRDAMADMQVG
ncbi:hypothetical protein CTA1_11185 [Colletotrichum tanaceti]|uniref:Uncharacterized protein n=1 Tax=Colletotrichum tanaceti TaxID=1306861 RepID=A0A4U6X4I9_9PEZI|nr:hypothetical protein CTA1_11185 [Colletotrichum tanaceti]